MNNYLAAPKDSVMAVIVEQFAGDIIVSFSNNSEDVDYIIKNCKKWGEFCKVVLINPDMYTGTELTK